MKLLTLPALLLILGATAAVAEIRVPNGASLQQTPIVHKAACNGTTGRYGCGPGWVRRCNKWGHDCRCRRC